MGDKVYHTWQEAIEHEPSIWPLCFGDLVTQPYQLAILPIRPARPEPLPRTDGLVVGVIVRQQQAFSGVVETSAEQMGDPLFKVTVKIMNLTLLAAAEQATRDTALLCSFVSTHAILQVNAGAFFRSSIHRLRMRPRLRHAAILAPIPSWWAKRAGRLDAGVADHLSTIRKLRRKARGICLMAPRSTKF